MTKHAFPIYTFREQKKYLSRHLIKSRSMKLQSFICWLQQLNAHLKEFSCYILGEETVPLPADKVMDIIYRSMPTM